MVRGVVNDAGIGKYQSFCAPLGAVKGVDVAFVVGISGGKTTFIIIEPVAADTHSVPGQRAPIPAVPVFCLILCDEVVGQSAVEMDIQSHIVFGGVAAVGIQIAGRRVGLRGIGLGR